MTRLGRVCDLPVLAGAAEASRFKTGGPLAARGVDGLRVPIEGVADMRGEFSFVALPLLLMMSLPPVNAAEEVPRLDVNSSCKLEAADAPETKKKCLDDENSARQSLARQWQQYPVSDRRLCTQTATLGGVASYVELITCLEMAAAARKLPANDK
jgi:hypothetical protein